MRLEGPFYRTIFTREMVVGGYEEALDPLILGSRPRRFFPDSNHDLGVTPQQTLSLPEAQPTLYAHRLVGRTLTRLVSVLQTGCGASSEQSLWV